MYNKYFPHFPNKNESLATLAQLNLLDAQDHHYIIWQCSLLGTPERLEAKDLEFLKLGFHTMRFRDYVPSFFLSTLESYNNWTLSFFPQNVSSENILLSVIRYECVPILLAECIIVPGLHDSIILQVVLGLRYSTS